MLGSLQNPCRARELGSRRQVIRTMPKEPPEDWLVGRTHCDLLCAPQSLQAWTPLGNLFLCCPGTLEVAVATPTRIESMPTLSC